MYELPWADADLSPFNPSFTDRAKIDSGHPVPCRLCEPVYRVLSLTMRHCASCEQGYCQPSHGGWVSRRGACVQCGPHQARSVQQLPAERPATAAPALRPEVPFEIFWPRVKEELCQFPGPEANIHLLTVRKWSQHSGEMDGGFTLIYRGGDTFARGTASTEDWCQVPAAEIQKVYEVWPEYRAGRKGRGFIVNDLGVQISTWIIPFLRRFEGLMV